MPSERRCIVYAYTLPTYSQRKNRKSVHVIQVGDPGDRVNIGILSESFDIPEVLKQRFADEETEDNKEGDLKDFCRKHDGVVLVKLMLPLTTTAHFYPSPTFQ